MGNIKGFIEHKRELPANDDIKKRIEHFNEFKQAPDVSLLKNQSSRCMECGVPFCHSSCPLGNLIPDFNDAVYKQEWEKAYKTLSKTNNFPEFTGRICPAPCEASCVLNINNDAVTIEYIEQSIIEKAFKNGWVKPKTNIIRNGRKVAIIGSGPAGMACAEQLNNKGYSVDLYEKNDKIGGLLRYGIPDFKLEKNIVSRRVELMKASGINMLTNINVGVDINTQQLQEKYDAIVLTGGSTVPRDLPVEGRHLKGIHFAMEYLEQNNRIVAGQSITSKKSIDIKDKNVLVIGGGDTGADCVGTSRRLQAKTVSQIELMSKPPLVRSEKDLWPNWPMVLRTSTSHEEGCDRNWSILTKRFVTNDGINVSGIEIVDIEWKTDENGKLKLIEKENTLRIISCEKVFLAIGFIHPKKEGLLEQLGVILDEKGNVFTDNFRTSKEKVYAAGDMRRGQSLVVWAIAEGRKAAEVIDNDFGGKELSLAL